MSEGKGNADLGCQHFEKLSQEMHTCQDDWIWCAPSKRPLDIRIRQFPKFCDAIPFVYIYH